MWSEKFDFHNIFMRKKFLPRKRAHLKSDLMNIYANFHSREEYSSRIPVDFTMGLVIAL